MRWPLRAFAGVMVPCVFYFGWRKKCVDNNTKRCGKKRIRKCQSHCVAYLSVYFSGFIYQSQTRSWTETFNGQIMCAANDSLKFIFNSNKFSRFPHRYLLKMEIQKCGFRVFIIIEIAARSFGTIHITSATEANFHCDCNFIDRKYR